MQKPTVKLRASLTATSLAVALLTAACLPAATPTPASTSAPQAFRIGLITSSGLVNDQSFNQSAWQGAQAGAQAVGGVADYIETKDAKDYGANLLQFADQGYDVIITVGFQLGQATLVAAKRYPNIKFIGVDQFQAEPVPNLAGLVFHEDQAGYLAGVLAAKMTQTGTVAAVLSTDLVPSMVAFKEGYEHGARSARPDIRIISTYYPGSLDTAFTDPTWGATTAAQAIGQDADVIFAAGGQTGNGGLIEAAARAKDTSGRLFCIGVDTDQWETLPEARPCLISSAMKLIEAGVVDLIRLAKDGRLPGGNYFGAVSLAPHHDFDSQVPDEVRKLLEATARALQDGSLQSGYGQ